MGVVSQRCHRAVSWSGVTEWWVSQEWCRVVPQSGVTGRWHGAVSQACVRARGSLQRSETKATHGTISSSTCSSGNKK